MVFALGKAGISPPRPSAAAYVAFAAFGVFWGAWGAGIPGIRAQAGISDGQLGTALLFIGAGALPAMLLTGRLIDRLGVRCVAAAALVLLAASGVLVALTARGFAGLSLGLLLVGGASGAADVAINSAAGSAETRTGRPVITRAHGMFSALVVASSLATGLATGLGFSSVAVFAAVFLTMAPAAGYVFCALPRPEALPRQRQGPGRAGVRAGGAPGPAAAVLATVLMGLLGALAYAGENAHQSWAAVFFADELGTGPGFGAVAPAVFAAVVAVTRFSTGGLNPEHARRVLVVGAAGAALGAATVALAPTVPVALAGLAAAAAGTAVLYPTLLGIVTRSTPEASRGRATSLLATVAYLGFLLGPVYVGLWSESVGLRGAMAAVAALGAALLILTPVLLRWRRNLIGTARTADSEHTAGFRQ